LARARAGNAAAAALAWRGSSAALFVVRVAVMAARFCRARARAANDPSGGGARASPSSRGHGDRSCRVRETPAPMTRPPMIAHRRPVSATPCVSTTQGGGGQALLTAW